MPVVTPRELKAALSRRQRLLGADLGEKTIGLALSDTERMVATPLETLKRTTFTRDAKRIISLIEQHGVGGLIVGLPVNMDGSEGPAAQSARAFARNFAKLSTCPAVLWDERLSTAAVTRTLLDANMSRRGRAKVVDKMAAAYFLQAALDALRR
ncbi:MAG: Holliday junction resolvase RuvX [Alphaproteobacteria bacterium]